MQRTGNSDPYTQKRKGIDIVCYGEGKANVGLHKKASKELKENMFKDNR